MKTNRGIGAIIEEHTCYSRYTALIMNEYDIAMSWAKWVGQFYNYIKIPRAISWYVWINEHMPGEVWDEITYLFPNVIGCTVGMDK